MDIYCKNCGEPWDVLSLREDFSEEERKRFFEGKGCPVCKGIPTLYCPKCDRVYKGWMRSDFTSEEIEFIWNMHKCPECLSELNQVRYDGKFFESVAENDGVIEDVLSKSLVDLL